MDLSKLPTDVQRLIASKLPNTTMNTKTLACLHSKHSMFRDVNLFDTFLRDFQKGTYTVKLNHPKLVLRMTTDTKKTKRNEALWLGELVIDVVGGNITLVEVTRQSKGCMMDDGKMIWMPPHRIDWISMSPETRRRTEWLAAFMIVTHQRYPQHLLARMYRPFLISIGHTNLLAKYPPNEPTPPASQSAARSARPRPAFFGDPSQNMEGVLGHREAVATYIKRKTVSPAPKITPSTPNGTPKSTPSRTSSKSK